MNELLVAAWHAAYLSRVKDFPKLDEILIKDIPHTEQTPEQMLLAAKMITAAFGGTVIEK